MALKKYTVWQKIRSTVLASSVGAVLCGTLGAVLTTLTVVFAPPLVIIGVTLFTAGLGGLVGGVVGDILSPKGDQYDDGYSSDAEFHTEKMYLENFEEAERIALEQIQFKAKNDWSVMWNKFDQACESLKPEFEDELVLLKKGLLRRLLRIKASVKQLQEITMELEGAINLGDKDDIFEEMARICDLLVLKREKSPFRQGSNSALERIFGGANFKREGQNTRWRKDKTPSNEQWQQWQEERSRGFFETLIRSFASFFSRNGGASQQSQSSPPPRITELERFVIIDHHNPYEILGVSRTASKKKIMQAYREAMRKWHPDKNKTPAASSKAQIIVEAKEILTNDNNRMALDAMLSQEAEPEYSRRQPMAYRM